MLELLRGSGMRRSLFAAAVTAWLLDHDWFRIIPNRWVESPMACASFCGFPAFHRSQCLGLFRKVSWTPRKAGSRDWRNILITLIMLAQG